MPTARVDVLSWNLARAAGLLVAWFFVVRVGFQQAGLLGLVLIDWPEHASHWCRFGTAWAGCLLIIASVPVVHRRLHSWLACAGASLLLALLVLAMRSSNAPVMTITGVPCSLAVGARCTDPLAGPTAKDALGAGHGLSDPLILGVV